MELIELLKKYNNIKCKHKLGTLSPELIPFYETVTAVIGSGELFPIIKSHYIDGLTIDTIADAMGYEARTVYRHQKAELTELELYINGSWLKQEVHNG
jgi:hypothetical protein